MRHRGQHRIILAAAAILLSAAPLPTAAGQHGPISTLNEEVTVVPEREVTPEQRRILSNAAAKVLRHIAAARGAIHKKDGTSAAKELDRVDKLIQIIKASRPVAKIRDHIWVARQHLAYEDTTEVAADLIPIYADLTEIEDLVPAQKVKKHLDTAKQSLKMGDKKGAASALAAMDREMLYTEIDLPLAETEQQVQRARIALRANRLEEADKALRAAEDGVEILAIAAEAPLTRARRSLWQAGRQIVAREYDKARKELDRAGAWLARAARSGDAGIRTEAKKLEKSLHDLRKKLASRHDKP